VALIKAGISKPIKRPSSKELILLRAGPEFFSPGRWNQEVAELGALFPKGKEGGRMRGFGEEN